VLISPAGLAQSLLMSAHRRLLDELGRAVGTPVVFLKAAWADPVLRGGRGERVGGDVDVLVEAKSFHRFARALTAHGYRHLVVPRRWATTRVHQAWVFANDNNPLPIDLHRGLTVGPWFHLPARECLARAIAYDGAAGPVLSLCPEDQVLYAAVHYCNHRFSIDQRHLDDVVDLARARAIDWSTLESRATRYGLLLPLALVLEALRARGVSAPPLRSPGPLFDLRLWRAHHWIATAPALARKRDTGPVHDMLFRVPLLSSRPLALPTFLGRYAGLRVLDAMTALAERTVGA
jgi:hypothetical protein